MPRPGGPEKSTWSSVSPRSFAAFTASIRRSRTFDWPTKPSKSEGRSRLSNAVDRFSSSLCLLSAMTTVYPFLAVAWLRLVMSLEAPTRTQVKMSISVESANTLGRLRECLVIDET